MGNADDNPSGAPTGVAQIVKLVFIDSSDKTDTPLHDSLINKLGCIWSYPFVYKCEEALRHLDLSRLAAVQRAASAAIRNCPAR